MRPLIVLLLLILRATHALAATYYIDPDWGGTESGTFAQPYDQWSDLPSMSTSDDVYLKCGTTLSVTSTIYINWNGTSGDYATIGAYYDNGGSPAYGVSGSKPIIDGNWDGTTTTSLYSRLIDIINQQYIKVENLNIINSEGTSVDFDYTDNASIEDCDISLAYNGGIKFAHSSTGEAIDCTITQTGKQRVLGASDYPASLAINRNATGYTVRGCKIHDNWGEGIGAYFGSNNLLIEKNTLYNNKVNIYMAQSYNITIRENLVYQTDYNGWLLGQGINVADEGGWGGAAMSYMYVYNNLIAGNTRGIMIGKWEGGSLTDLHIYNNTLAGNQIGMGYGDSTTPTFSNCYVKNNIIWTLSGDSPSSAETNSIDWDYNQWYGYGTPDADTTGSNDTDTNPLLQKTSGWDYVSLTPDSLDVDDFAPATGSTAVNSGVTLASPYDQLLNSDSSNLQTHPFSTSTVNQTDYGAFDRGAVLNIGTYAPFLSGESPTTQQQCGSDPQSVMISFGSTTNCNCRISTNAAHTTYAAMSDQVDNGENTTYHSESKDQACGGQTTYYAICNDGTYDSNRLTILVDVAAAADPGVVTLNPLKGLYHENGAIMTHHEDGFTVLSQ